MPRNPFTSAEQEARTTIVVRALVDPTALTATLRKVGPRLTQTVRLDQVATMEQILFDRWRSHATNQPAGRVLDPFSCYCIDGYLRRDELLGDPADTRVRYPFELSARQDVMYCGLSSAGGSVGCLRTLPRNARGRRADASHREPALWRHAAGSARVCRDPVPALLGSALRELYSGAAGYENRSNGGSEVRIGPSNEPADSG